MNALRSAPLLLCLFWSQWLRAQISTDTCCVSRVRAAIPKRASVRGFYRFTSSLGVAAQYCLDASDNKAFQNVGVTGTVAADYYFRRRFGLGMEVGYLNYSLQPIYTQFFDQMKVLNNLPPNPTEQLPINNMYSFHVLAGPVLSVNFFHRLTLTTALRGGVFYNDAPTGSVYDLTNQQLLYQFSTNDKRWQPGGLVSVVAYYPLSPIMQLGLGAAVFASPLTYTVENTKGKSYNFSRVLSGYNAFASLVLTLRKRPISEQLPVVLPDCYAPVLVTTEPLVYNAAAGEAPLIKWRSGAPIYTTDEEFTFRLYALPTSKLLLELTTTKLQLGVPLALKLPEATTQLYYTVQASRRDQAAQRCRSPVITGSVRVVRK